MTTRTCPVCTDVDILATPTMVAEELCLCRSCRATWIERGSGPEDIQPSRTRRAPLLGPRLERTGT